MQKSELYMIQTQATDMTVAKLFQGKIGVFPTNYLGLPLHIGRTRRVDEQVLVDKNGARLEGSIAELGRSASVGKLRANIHPSIPYDFFPTFQMGHQSYRPH
jgi:hypothetical protein